jgi:uncharacterized protein (DUF2147 family)
MKNIALLFITSLLISNMSLASNSNADVILGEWLSQEKDGKISIFKQGDKYYGKISWGKTPGKKDTNNPDTKLKNRDLLGLVILQDFKFTGSTWEEGKIYDPKSGKTYDCILKVKDNNKILEIRGYVGVPMFGRTATWTRP